MAPTPRPPTYSPSKLASYQACPRQYAYKYVRKLPGRIRPNQSFGASLHRALHSLYEAGGPGARDAEGLRQQLAASWSDVGYADADHAASELARGQEILARFAASWAEEATIPVLLEKRLTAPYRDVTFLGIVDRVDRLADGRLHVIDYKSGWAPDDRTVPRTTAQQLALYGHLVRSNLGEWPGAYSVHYLASDLRLSIEFPEPTALLDEAHATAVAIREAGEHPGAYPATPGSACMRCDYAGRCDLAIEGAIPR